MLGDPQDGRVLQVVVLLKYFLNADFPHDLSPGPRTSILGITWAR